MVKTKEKLVFNGMAQLSVTKQPNGELELRLKVGPRETGSVMLEALRRMIEDLLAVQADDFALARMASEIRDDR